MAAFDPAARKRVLRVIAVSLLLDLVRDQLQSQDASNADLSDLDLFYFHPPVVPATSRVLP